MTAGELRQRITIEASSQVSDGHDGFQRATWTPVLPGRMAAMVASLAGKALELARQIDPRAAHDVTVRYWRNYRADCPGPGTFRIVWHDGPSERVLEPIEPWREDAYRVALQVSCRERA